MTTFSFPGAAFCPQTRTSVTPRTRSPEIVSPRGASSSTVSLNRRLASPENPAKRETSDKFELCLVELERSVRLRERPSRRSLALSRRQCTSGLCAICNRARTAKGTTCVPETTGTTDIELHHALFKRTADPSHLCRFPKDQSLWSDTSLQVLHSAPVPVTTRMLILRGCLTDEHS